MRETVARFRAVLVARLNLLEEEARLGAARLKEGEGDYHYVVLGNIAVVERQIADVGKLRTEFENMDIEQFQSVAEFKEFVLARLQKLYEARAFIRLGVRMVMECVRDM